MLQISKIIAVAAVSLILGACDDPAPPIDHRQADIDRGNAAVAECVAIQCERLDLDSAALADYSILGSMTHVKALMISYTDFSDLGDIAAMTQLEELHIGQTDVSDLSGLSAFPNLKVLHAQQMRNVSDYSPIGQLRRLDELAIGDYQTSPASVIAALPQLRRVVLYIDGEEDLSPLAGHPGLEVVDFTDSYVNDISPLLTMPRLRQTSVPDFWESSPIAADAEALMARGVVVYEQPSVVVC
ncbi:leucine-rich repeat domain-containing protein [Flavimaricola marinus]|uniref:Internalin-A n=1 Tax=Flavimaricola marinus TaxID=1819565 RepID=A0A238LHV9_9RHOB|nr:leucine-rich repeat domain-containing protein [Flavimaricola marinus]SMY08546.1 Internalin-A precursor [Flavimaricola marinus]